MPENENYLPQTAWLNLGEGYSDPVRPASFPKHKLRYRNQRAAQTVGLESLSKEEWINSFAHFTPLAGNLPKPLALRYHGHQFTHYNPDLGDGRGFLFAQLTEKETGKLLDLGTKGSGQTPYSRRGDGRLTLKGAVREALATTYLEYQGVNTSKTFSIIETGEELERGDEPSPTRSAVLVRLSHSHVRFGTFQRLAFFKEKEKMERLIECCLTHFYQETTKEHFFEQVCRSVAKTTAQWMSHGFVHGVLNTDNINITGESFDYGPYRFLPHYDPSFTAAYFDHSSLYAFGKQPQMIFWNLERLRDALKLIWPEDTFYEPGFKTFQETFEEETFYQFCKKIGVLAEDDKNKTKNLFYSCLQFLEKSKAPFEQFFWDLNHWHQELTAPLRDKNPELYDNSIIEDIEKEMATFKRDPKTQEKTNLKAKTLLIDEIETIWEAIDKEDDWSPFNEKIKSLL